MNSNFYTARIAALQSQNMTLALAGLILTVALIGLAWFMLDRTHELKAENADHIAVIEAHALEAAALRKRADQLQADGLVLAHYFRETTEPFSRPERVNAVLIRTLGPAAKTRSISLDEWRTAAPGIRRELSRAEQYEETARRG